MSTSGLQCLLATLNALRPPRLDGTVSCCLLDETTSGNVTTALSSWCLQAKYWCSGVEAQDVWWFSVSVGSQLRPVHEVCKFI